MCVRCLYICVLVCVCFKGFSVRCSPGHKWLVYCFDDLKLLGNLALSLMLYLKCLYTSDELLLQEDGSDSSGIATEFSKGMHLGQNLGSVEPLVGVGRFNHVSSTSSSISRPIQPFLHAEVGSPPTHDPHAGYVRSMSKPSHFVPHISQNSPSRLGQQPIQRLNYGRSTASRGNVGDWSQTKPSPPSFNSGGPRSPGSGSFGNGMSWGNYPLSWLSNVFLFHFFSFCSQPALTDYNINLT